ncbi:MAG: thioredoxin domain-containing protein [Candidatus Ancillula sp.]|nr:thioredoxin domain-containing protein [Candidatus Ancillula sp.]
MAVKNAPKKASINVKVGTAKKSSAKSARELSDALRAQQAEKDKRNRLIFGGIIAAVAIAVVVVIIVIVVTNPKSEANLKQAIKDSGNVPSLFNEDGSFTVSKNGGGKDKAISGAVNLEIFNDFICPSCGGFERAYGATLEELVETGKVNIIFHPLAWFDRTSPLEDGTSDKYSSRVAAAAIYIAQNVPDKYMAFVKSMYSATNQPCEGIKGTNTTQCTRPERGYDKTVGSDEKIKEHIVEAGISKQVAEAAVSGKYASYIKAVSDYINVQGRITGTPAIFINNKKYDLTGSPAQFKEEVLAAK